MKVLVTSSRLPFALDLIRKLASCGHSVYASDTYPTAPGSHSRYLAEHFVTAAPNQETEQFISDLKEIVTTHSIDLLLPAFEEACYLAAHKQDLSELTTVFTGNFESLAKLHNKSSFKLLVESLGIKIAKTIVARSPEELASAVGKFERYFARAVYSRGGVTLLTNSGPLAGKVKVEECKPTTDSPWLVQEYVDGPVICTYSILQDGVVKAHCTYETPHKWKHSTGIAFRSIDGGQSEEVVRTIASALNYSGQLSFDFIVTEDGLSIVECNPRATDGVLLMSPEQISDAIFKPTAVATVVEPGIVTELDLAVFGAIFADGFKSMPKNIHDLIETPGAGHGWHDLVPDLYSFLAFAHHANLSHHNRQKLLDAMADDISWNGQPIAGMSDRDREVLKAVQSA